MTLNYYIIRGRGADGSKFQLAKLLDDQGNQYKNQYDMSRQFGSIDELKAYLANDVVNKELSELNFAAMTI